MHATTSGQGGTSSRRARVGRDALRERERQSRQRRVARMTQMRAQVEALECALTVVTIAPESGGVWDEFLDENARRVREYLLKSKRLHVETLRLARENGQLGQLLDERQLASAEIARQLREMQESDSWESSVMRWRAIARAYSEPWGLPRCLREMEVALQQLHAFAESSNKVSSGVSVFGWVDSRRIDASRHALEFSFQKSFRGFDLLHHMDVYWRMYTEQETYSRVCVSGRNLGMLEVVQEVASNIRIVRYVERYATLDINAHMQYLVFRLQTETGFTQCMWSIPPSDEERAMGTRNDMWASNSIWMQWEAPHEGEDLRNTDYELVIGGTLMGEDEQYAHRWLFEALTILLRAEAAATGRKFLT